MDALRSMLFAGPRPLRKVALGDWPTPVTEVALDPPGIRFLAKREDLSSALYGGNKVRKLEFLLSEGPGPVITAGALGSHHVLACAVHARRVGRGCVGLLVGRPPTAHAAAVQELLERHLRSAVRLDRPWELPRAIGRALEEAGGPRAAREALWIPPGASNAAGTLGYVACGLELAEQVAAGECPRPSRVYTALGTGGTAAGLALGLALAGLGIEVVAVRVAAPLSGNRAFLEVLARRTFSLLIRRGLAAPWPGLRLRVEHGFAGPGYGHPTPAAERAVALARTAGLALETTYTGKALAALIEDSRAPRSRGAGPALFLQTCGALPRGNGAPAGAGTSQEDRCTTTP
jgi:D-cysteine desulfhydrase